MLPLLIGGVALAATGYGVKKYFESDENCEKAQEVLFKSCEWLDEASEKSDQFFDELNQYVEEYFASNEAEIEDDDEVEDKVFNVQEFQKCIEYYEKAKNKLFTTTLQELHIALSQIDNLNQEIIMPSKYCNNMYKELIINDHHKEVFYQCTSILQSAQIYLYTELEKLNELLLKSKDFTNYSDTEKVFVQKLVNLNSDILEATESMIILDNEVVQDIKSTYTKIEETIQ